MNQKICDFCGEIIKQKIIYLTVTEVAMVDEETNKLASFLTIEEMFHVIKQRQT